MSAVSFAYAFSNISIKEKKRAVQKPQPKRVEPQEEEEQCPAPYDVNTTTAEMIKREVCFQISTDLMATLPFFTLQRDGKRRAIDLFSLSNYTGKSGDTFSITAHTPSRMLYLNLRLHDPSPLGRVTVLDGCDENWLQLPLLHADFTDHSAVQRKKKDRSGRTVFQFQFVMHCDVQDQIMTVVEGILVCFPTP
jgi:hypothetical protein